jgi:osmotically-inducible protein OsmY
MNRLFASRSRQALLGGVCAAVLATACVSAQPKTAAQMSADRLLADQVEAALNSDPVYYFRHVDVQVDSGNVWLSGYVWSDDALRRAVRIATRVPGVTTVADRLELERNGGRPTR